MISASPLGTGQVMRAQSTVKGSATRRQAECRCSIRRVVRTLMRRFDSVFRRYCFEAMLLHPVEYSGLVAIAHSVIERQSYVNDSTHGDLGNAWLLSNSLQSNDRPLSAVDDWLRDEVVAGSTEEDC